MIVETAALQQMERRYRANFINSLGGFKSLVLIGTSNEDGSGNLATFSSLFHLGADPALCGIIIRPAEPGQNTLGNILRTKQYTLNHVLPHFYREAHQCSAKYPQGQSEFEAVGLQPYYAEGIAAPFVQQSRIRFYCELVQCMPVELNGTTLVIGAIRYIDVPGELVGDDGFIDLEAAGTVTCSGLDSYHTTRRLGRLRYAKAGTAPAEL